MSNVALHSENLEAFKDVLREQCQLYARTIEMARSQAKRGQGNPNLVSECIEVVCQVTLVQARIPSLVASFGEELDALEKQPHNNSNKPQHIEQARLTVEKLQHSLDREAKLIYKVMGSTIQTDTLLSVAMLTPEDQAKLDSLARDLGEIDLTEQLNNRIGLLEMLNVLLYVL